MVDSVRLADYDTGKPTTLQPRAKLFARAIFDPSTKQVVELDLTAHQVPPDTAYQAVKAYAVARSTVQPAPEIVGIPLTGKEVPVSFVVTVPPNTPLQADIYISTDASGWNPQAIKMDRIDGQRYRATRRFASGTKFAWRVTRGSWMPANTSSMIASGFSERGLSLVRIATSASRAAAAPISGRLALSRSPPQPSTIRRLPAVTGRKASSTASTAPGLCE